ncbi:MAG: nuclease-related domain-containing protein, partial [Xanthomonadales bacterium]|nr:nuclease-related domain-containing protein [Xanthomonadales bacterium]
MARIVPSDLSRLALSGAHQPELATLALLKDALPDHYTVFHGVHWSRQYQGTTIYGEVDFVVLNRAGQVLCIEQKNGPLLERDGALVKVYGEQEKNVGDQILRAIGNIKNTPGLNVDRWRTDIVDRYRDRVQRLTERLTATVWLTQK